MTLSPCRLLEGALVDHLKELVIVAVIDVSADDHRPRRIECFLQDRDDLIRSSNHETRGPNASAYFTGLSCGRTSEAAIAQGSATPGVCFPFDMRLSLGLAQRAGSIAKVQGLGAMIAQLQMLAGRLPSMLDSMALTS